MLACLPAACGGGGDDGGVSEEKRAADEKAAGAVLVEALTTKDPGACTRLLTQTAVEQSTLRHGRAAVRECRSEADEPGAASASVTRVTVDGDRATADVEPRGGSFTFRRATFGMRKQGGRWKVDRMTAGTLDRPAFMRDARKEMREPPDALSPGVTSCVLGELAGVQDAALVGIYVNSDVRVIVVPMVVCVMREQLAGDPRVTPLLGCIGEGIRRELTTGAVGRAIAEEADIERLDELVDSRRFTRVVQATAFDCARAAALEDAAGGVS